MTDKIELPTLPKSLLDTIGEYGMARTDGVDQLEIQHRWLTLIDGIKCYASDYALLANAPQVPEGVRVTAYIKQSGDGVSDYPGMDDGESNCEFIFGTNGVLLSARVLHSQDERPT